MYGSDAVRHPHGMVVIVCYMVYCRSTCISSVDGHTVLVLVVTTVFVRSPVKSIAARCRTSIGHTLTVGFL